MTWSNGPEGRQRPPEGTNGATTGTAEATNMRRSAYRAAISAGTSTDSVDNTIPSHRVHRFIQPDCDLPSLRRFPWLFVGFRQGRLASRSLVYVSNALLTLGVLFCSISEILLPRKGVTDTHRSKPNTASPAID